MQRWLRPALNVTRQVARRQWSADAATAATEEARAGATAGEGTNQVTLNFFCPHMVIARNRSVSSVIVPASSGLMGILPNHVPTVAQMRPGVVTIYHEDSKEERYFVSSGFTFVHPDRTDICAVEAVRLEDLDPEEINKALAECEAKLAAASSSGATDAQRAAIAQIGVDVYLAMQGAVSSSR
ncbi:ATP synthase subunit delta, mitochondrial [Cyanidiococcus yangmingshanensis]|uniref:ATP synthase subunit delta, mitochondrial n=1 Tax=Cyanidiococcus yangmingshanensis TaxID=2690220 RepID=A0A7J7II58_9RHOD|nr:ATP synthase subunit delta, mitochondrial [Cyanidiococcus yangmingshanensis]